MASGLRHKEALVEDDVLALPHKAPGNRGKDAAFIVAVCNHMVTKEDMEVHFVIEIRLHRRLK
ncbi:MAG: hypothetical protein NTAFB01_17190 [Nitrospira sp.]